MGFAILRHYIIRGESCFMLLILDLVFIDAVARQHQWRQSEYYLNKMIYVNGGGCGYGKTAFMSPISEIGR